MLVTVGYTVGRAGRCRCGRWEVISRNVRPYLDATAWRLSFFWMNMSLFLPARKGFALACL